MNKLPPMNAAATCIVRELKTPSSRNGAQVGGMYWLVPAALTSNQQGLARLIGIGAEKPAG